MLITSLIHWGFLLHRVPSWHCGNYQSKAYTQLKIYKTPQFYRSTDKIYIGLICQCTFVGQEKLPRYSLDFEVLESLVKLIDPDTDVSPPLHRESHQQQHLHEGSADAGICMYLAVYIIVELTLCYFLDPPRLVG